MERFFFCALCFTSAAVISEGVLTSSLGTAKINDEPSPLYLPAMTQLSTTPPLNPECQGAQHFPYKFSIKVEFNVCSFFVFLGVLRICRRHKKLACCLDILSSVYLLWATFTRSYYVHSTQVAQWTIDVCSAITSDRGLIRDYLFVSIASWISSLFLELKSSARFVKLFGNVISGGLHPGIRWSRCRKAVLLTASLCTLNSVFLTMMLRGAVKQSLTNVSEDASIFIIQNLATFMRFTRQCMEGAIFIVGIATRAFRWKNSHSEVLFSGIAFSSFVLLIHSSVLMNTFSKQETQFRWVQHYAVLASLFADIVFRFVVCIWALCNSNIPCPKQPENRHPPRTQTVAPNYCIQCALLAYRHLTQTPQPMIQPFPELPRDTLPSPPPSPSSEAVDYSDPVSVDGPFPLCRLEIVPQQETGRHLPN